MLNLMDTTTVSERTRQTATVIDSSKREADMATHNRDATRSGDPLFEAQVKDEQVIDLTTRWSTLMPILISAIEHGTSTGRSNALRRLRELGVKVDSMHSLQLRMRANLAHLLAVSPQIRHSADPDVQRALTEALELLSMSKPSVLPVRRS
ncbi:hypothetical protein N0A02_14455 [Paraburkholderia acidicola]|uniref:Uncharacterized protein n=1 Tax=Paraburkholderia acidicola TaxID=1912599 RepID=A0ABV1LMV9_9BURK